MNLYLNLKKDFLGFFVDVRNYIFKKILKELNKWCWKTFFLFRPCAIGISFKDFTKQPFKNSVMANFQ